MNHSVLFDKLSFRDVPFYFTLLLVHWYEHLVMRVRVSGVYSTPFRVSNGYLQGGVLSPYLLIMYVDMI